MTKKKKNSKAKIPDFNNDPFNDLKGFVGSDPKKEDKPTAVPVSAKQKIFGSFTDEMEMLGVKQLNADLDTDAENSTYCLPADCVEASSTKKTDADIFLAAMGDLTVKFEDHLSEADSPSVAIPKRMKQLKQGRLSPEASLDLHGLKCSEVVERLRHFLENSQYHGWQTLLVITGKGLHSQDGEPVLRNEVERFLNGEGKKLIVEWGRAPKQYGGDGALVLFLRKNND
ncbi:MAG: Smr/MutS family protein [Desulfuromusa sp.]|nr:Smr/MutS family protein [Desulfuromusa sp.]